MKNKLNFLWLIAVIGLIAISCDNGNNNTTKDPCANGHYFPEWTAPTCTVEGNSVRTCTRSGCDATDPRTTGYEKLPHTVSSWTFKTAADCITSEIEKGTCTVCGEEDTRYSSTNHAVGHTINPLTKVSVSFGVFEGPCIDCGEPTSHEFTYAIGDTGPAGGIIFYVADGEDSRPDGITIQGYGSSGDNGYFAEYTAYYLEAAPANETTSANIQWGAHGTLIDGITTGTNVASITTTSIGFGRKDTQTIVNSTAFAALTDTAAQRCANKNFGGKTDWFLPSLGEFNEMYKARVAGVTGIPTTGWLWSSSQYNGINAWFQGFDSGLQDVVNKYLNYNVRAIRAF